MKHPIIPDKTWDKNPGKKEKLRIAVCSSHFISGLLAASLCGYGSVCLTELGTPYFYTALNMEKRFAGRSFNGIGIYLEEHKPLRLFSNKEEHINWAINKEFTLSGGETVKLAETDGYAGISESDAFRLSANLLGDFVILDLSGASEELSLKVCADAEKQVLVVDPLPSLLLSQYKFVERFLCDFPEAVIVVNRMNGGVHRGALRNFLCNKEYIGFPYIDPKFIYRAEYDASLPYSLPQIKTAAGPALEQLLDRLQIT